MARVTVTVKIEMGGLIQMKKLGKSLLALVLALVMAVALVGCGGSGGNDDGDGNAVQGETVDLVIATAGTAGAWYPIGTGMAEIITRLDNGINAMAEVTNGGIENGRLVGENAAQIGFMNNDAAYFAYNGEEPFDKKENILAVASLYPSTMQVAVLADSDIETIEDLRGKRVVVGPPASSSAIMSENVLSEYGLSTDDYEGLTLSFAEGAQAMSDGHADCVVVVSAHPNNALMELDVTKGIRLIPVDGEARDKAAEKHQYYDKFTIPAGTYPSIDYDIETLSLGTMLVANNDLSEDVVYKFLEGIYGNLEELGGVHAMAKQIALEHATLVPIPFHPGAEKYFQEQGLL